MSLGEFFQQILEWIYALWPIRIIYVFEQGVRFYSGNVTKLLTSTNGWFGTGVHGFFPIVGEIFSAEVNARVIETTWQTLVTKDGHAVSFSLAARYQIRDLGKMLVEIHDPEETIENHLSAAAAEAIQDLKLAELEKKLPGAVKAQAMPRLRDWGVSLREVNLFNRVEAQTLRLLNE